jgi:thiosulfate sulfurtransferase
LETELKIKAGVKPAFFIGLKLLTFPAVRLYCAPIAYGIEPRDRYFVKTGMKLRLRQASIILALSAFFAIIFNSFSDDGIPLKGNWPSVGGSNSVIVPPSAAEGDPPFISLDEAAAKFQSKNVIFLDARLPEDYQIGRIRGAVNLPFEELEAFWPKIRDSLPFDKEYVVYCSGDECELSLFLGREMMAQGYKNISIFYGGWREWEKAKLPIERE